MYLEKTRTKLMNQSLLILLPLADFAGGNILDISAKKLRGKEVFVDIAINNIFSWI